jgi:DNA-binding transcriptional ArsR family regulator
MTEEAKLQSFIRANPLAFEIIGLMWDSSRRLTITEISSALKKKQPSVHRVLQRLMKLGLVEKERSGRFTFYDISNKKRDVVDRLIHTSLRFETWTHAHVQPPLFMLLSLESRISRILTESLKKLGAFRVASNVVIPGKNFDHEFDILIENKLRIAIEIVSSGGKIDQRLFEVAGRLADLSRNSIDKVVLVSIGHLHQPSLSYLKSLDLKGSPKLEVISLEEPLCEIDEEVIKRKVVPLLERLLTKQANKTIQR